MQNSRKWFTRRSYQQTYSRVSEIPAVARHGPNFQDVSKGRTQNADGQKLFQVGKTKVGGEEVVA